MAMAEGTADVLFCRRVLASGGEAEMSSLCLDVLCCTGVPGVGPRSWLERLHGNGEQARPGW